MDKPRLDSWKEIARYLGRDVRTAARWEQERRLPVHRVPGGKKSHVFAYPQELDEWLAGVWANPGPEADDPPLMPPRPPGAPIIASRRVIAVAAGVGLLGLTVTAGSILMGLTGTTDRLSLVGNELVALDRSGRTRWAHRFDAEEVSVAATRWSHIGDVDRDGREDVLATVEVAGSNRRQLGGTLLDFTSDGSLRWSSTIDDRVSFQGSEYGPPWASADLSVYQAGGQSRIAWVLHHFTWWPGLLVTFDPEGRRLGTFVNSGWIRAVTASADGRFLLASGVTNRERAYFFAVLDAEHPTGRSPEPPGSAFECVTCGAGDPLSYYVFPRSDVGGEHPFPADGPSIQTFPDGTALVQTHESTAPDIAAAIYQFSPDFAVRSVGFSDSFWEWHRRLERDGRLDHAAGDCPARRGLEVQQWTAGRGWQTLMVPVR